MNIEMDKKIYDYKKNIFYKNKTKDKWKQISLSDKKIFFNLWHYLIMITCFFQLFSAFINLGYPVLTDRFQLINALSCAMTWFSICYFFDTDNRLNILNRIILKSFHTASYVLLFFAVILMNYVFLGMIIYTKFPYFSKLNKGFIMFFSLIYSDQLFNNVMSLYFENPISSLIGCFIFFLTFYFLFLRIFITIVVCLYDSEKIKEGKHWVWNKINFKDYLRDEIKKEMEQDDDDEDKNYHHMLTYNLFSIILENEEEKNIESFDNNLEDKIGLSIMSKNIINNNQLEKLCRQNLMDIYLRKQYIKIKRDNLSKSYLNSLLNLSNEEIEKIKINRVNPESKHLKLYYKYGEAFIENIENNLRRINKFLRNKNNFTKLTNKEIENMMNQINKKMIDYLKRIKIILKNTQ
jgi:hypothetical protein